MSFDGVMKETKRAPFLLKHHVVLGWVTVCGQVNHLGITNQPPTSTQPSIPPG